MFNYLVPCYEGICVSNQKMDQLIIVDYIFYLKNTRNKIHANVPGQKNLRYSI